MLDYLSGSEHCRTNSRRLETSARIILKDEDGTDSFALFLYHIAYEEIAKGIFCLFVHRNWINEEFVNRVFEDHRAKIFLYEEIFRSFEVKEGICYLGGKKLGEIPFSDFIAEHRESINSHRRKTMDFLYVDKNSDWIIPEVEFADIDEKEKEIRNKIRALDLIFQFVLTGQYKNSNYIDNFKFFENDDESFSIRFDQT